MRWTGIIIPFAMASVAMAQPGLVLDDFDSAINDEMGGARTVSLQVLANPFSQNTQFEVAPGYSFAAITGAAVFNSGLAARQTGTLSWGGSLGLDASAYDRFELDFLQADQDFTLSIDLLGGSGGSASWSGIIGATATAETVSIAFDDFTTLGGFDLADLDAITMHFNSGATPVSSLDFVLTEFRTTVIPTPGTAAVLGLSGLALGRRRRR